MGHGRARSCRSAPPYSARNRRIAARRQVGWTTVLEVARYRGTDVPCLPKSRAFNAPFDEQSSCSGICDVAIYVPSLAAHYVNEEIAPRDDLIATHELLVLGFTSQNQGCNE